MGETRRMGISYNPLFKLLINQGMKKTDLCEKVGLSL
jgi:DNA-binding Xre family transcriptional regulator